MIALIKKHGKNVPAILDDLQDKEGQTEETVCARIKQIQSKIWNKKLIDPELREKLKISSKEWSNAEIETLKDLLITHGCHALNLVAAQMKGRSKKKIEAKVEELKKSLTEDEEFMRKKDLYDTLFPQGDSIFHQPSAF